MSLLSQYLQFNDSDNQNCTLSRFKVHMRHELIYNKTNTAYQIFHVVFLSSIQSTQHHVRVSLIFLTQPPPGRCVLCFVVNKTFHLASRLYVMPCGTPAYDRIAIVVGNMLLLTELWNETVVLCVAFTFPSKL